MHVVFNMHNVIINVILSYYPLAALLCGLSNMFIKKKKPSYIAS